jgi:hypothetical protein
MGRTTLSTARGRRIAIFGLALVIVAGGFAVGRRLLQELTEGNKPAEGEALIVLTVGAEQIAVPANRLRFADQRRPGSYPRVELELKWPGLGPVTPDDPAAKSTARDGQLVFIAIEPRETDLDTADRIATIYQTFLKPDEGNPPATVGGLAKRTFIAKTAYEGEALYFEPGSVHPFAARCYAETKGEPPVSCLREVRLGKHLLATIRFPVSWFNGLNRRCPFPGSPSGNSTKVRRPRRRDR